MMPLMARVPTSKPLAPRQLVELWLPMCKYLCLHVPTHWHSRWCWLVDWCWWHRLKFLHSHGLDLVMLLWCYCVNLCPRLSSGPGHACDAGGAANIWSQMMLKASKCETHKSGQQYSWIKVCLHQSNSISIYWRRWNFCKGWHAPMICMSLLWSWSVQSDEEDFQLDFCNGVWAGWAHWGHWRKHDGRERFHFCRSGAAELPDCRPIHLDAYCIPPSKVHRFQITACDMHMSHSPGSM